MVETRLFAEMRGSEIFTFLRTALADEAHRKRSFMEQSYRVGGSVPSDEERQRCAALEAATQLLEFLVTEGIVASEKRRRRGPPREEYEVLVELLTRAAAQARYALIEPEPDDEQATG